MDPDTILNRLAEVDDIAERTALLDAMCGEDLDERERLAEVLHSRNISVNPRELPTKPPSVGKTVAVGSSLIGKRLGHYEILEPLGEGGMGVVYLAQQEHPVKRRVAIKVTKPGFETQELMARFQAERQALALMDHENIAKVLDAGTTEEGRLYFVMELVKGVPITEYCDTRHLTTTQRLELFVTVCRAIQHAHQKGVVHRDVKPSNVLVVEMDGEAVPKVIDFGLAKALEQQLAPQTLHTQFGQVMGTLEYMSPEQARFTAVDVDTRSDVYSLGVLLYELLTGTTPIGRNRLHQLEFDELLRVIRDEEPSRPSIRLTEQDAGAREQSALRQSDTYRLREQLRGDLDLIALKALAKDRDRRYESAAALAADVRRFLHDEPIEARSPSAIYLIRKFARRNRALVVGLSAVFAALALGIGFSTYFAVNAHYAAQRAEQQTQRAQKQRDLALSTLQDVVYQIQMPLAEIPAARDVRQEMLNGAILGLKRMAEEFEDDYDSSRVMMIAIEDIGEIFLTMGPSADAALEMDHREFAEQQFRRAKQLADKHIEKWPDDEKTRFDMYFVLTRLSMVQASLGRAEESVASLQEARPYIESIAPDAPEKYTSSLFNNYHALSGMNFLAGDLEQAIKWTNEAVRVAEEVAAKKLELDEPIYEEELAELRLRQVVFRLLPNVINDPTLAMEQPDNVKHRVLVDRSKHFLRAGDLVEAERTLDLLLGSGELDGKGYYGTACRYGNLAEATLGGRDLSELNESERAQFERYASQSIELLQKARATGYFDEIYQGLSLLNRDPDLDPLRDRDDFKELLSSLE